MTETDQARRRYLSLSEQEKQALINNIGQELWFVSHEVQEKILCLFGQVDRQLEKKLRERLQF